MIRPTVVLIAAVLLLGPLLVLELGARSLIETGRLPTAPSTSLEADISIANLERMGRPDVLVLGNSSMHNALSPDVLEKLVETETGQRIRVHNLALGGLVHDDQRVLVKGLAERDLLPDTVIIGLTPTSMTGRWDREGWLAASELGRAWSGCADLEGYEQWSCRLGQRSALWRWRGYPERLTAAMTEPLPTTISGSDREVFENGWVSARPATRKRLERLLSPTVERLSDEVTGSPVVVSQFAALVDDLRAQGVTVLVVTVPYSPPLQEALVERNPDWETQLAAGYADLAEAADVAIIAVPDAGDDWAPDWQRDHRHLSRKGARIVTSRLWETPEFREALLEGLTAVDR